MHKKKLSINDIANHLKISKSTVSLIINGKAEKNRISKSLEQKVLDYVAQVGFEPHHLAKSLATGKSNSIGLIVENIGDSFFGPIALMIEERAKKEGYRVMYSSTLDEKTTAEGILKIFRSSNLDGYIIAPPNGLEDTIQQIQTEGKPIVVFDRKPNIEVDYVGTNNKELSYMACAHLVEQGYSNIGFVTLISEQNQMTERLEGYHEALKNYGLEPKVLSFSYGTSKTDQKEGVAKFLQDNKQIDALYFSANHLCLNGLHTIKEHGKKIPEDYAVLSFDDHEAFSLIEPTITAIEQPLYELSETIVDLLMKRIDDKENFSEGITRIEKSKLLIRESTKKHL